jgi:hypothetical protein
MVFVVLQVAGDGLLGGLMAGLLHGVWVVQRNCFILVQYWYNLACLKKKNDLHGLVAVTKT